MDTWLLLRTEKMSEKQGHIQEYSWAIKIIQMFMVIKKIWYLKSNESDDFNEMNKSHNSSDRKSFVEKADILVINIFFALVLFFSS